MLGYIAARLAVSLITILGVATIVFAVLHFIPGGPVQALGGPQAVRSPEVRAGLEKEYGLDKPLAVQYELWLRKAVRGDLGESFGTHFSVSSEIVRRGGVTLELTLLATAFSLLVGVPAGVFAALRNRSALDVATRATTLVGLSIPDFVLGSLLIYFVSTRHIGLPVSGYTSWHENAWQHLRCMILPTFTLGLITTSVVARITRSSVLEVLNEPYVVTARAKGLHPRAIALRHVVRTALIPTVTIVGINMGYLLSGAVIVEQLFSLPGLGRFALQAVISRDYPVAQGAVIVGALTFVLMNLLTDVAYAVLDPRIKY